MLMMPLKVSTLSQLILNLLIAHACKSVFLADNFMRMGEKVTLVPDEDGSSFRGVSGRLGDLMLVDGHLPLQPTGHETVHLLDGPYVVNDGGQLHGPAGSEHWWIERIDPGSVVEVGPFSEG